MEEVIKQSLIVKDRKTLELDGVKSIVEFTDTYLVIDTVGGRLCVEGKALKVEGLSKDSGELSVVGEIDGVFYKTDGNTGGWLSRIFK